MLLGCALLGLAAFAKALTYYTPENVTDTVDGIKILRGHAPQGSYLVSQSSIWSNLSFVQDGTYARVKSGNVTHLKFTQADVDLIAQTVPNGRWDFYEYFPIARDGVPFPDPIYADVSKTEPKCCSVENTTTDTDTLRNASNARKSLDLSSKAFVPSYTLLGLPVSPRVDPFYKPAFLTYLFLKKGTPFGYRRIGYNILYFSPDTKVYQIQYRTENSKGSVANADITTLFVPASHDNVNFISYQMHEDADNPDCAYSYWFHLGYIDVYLKLFLDYGWPVSIPDYEGRLSVFGANYRAGKSILDSIQAVQQMNSILGIRNMKAFLYGYSSGATVTAVAGEMTRSYAPSLVGDVRGMAIGGFVSNITATTLAVNQDHFAGLIPMILNSLAIEYPEFGVELAGDLGPDWWKIPLSTISCSWTLYLFYGQNMFSLERDRESFLQRPVVKQVLRQQSAMQHAPPFPVYIMESAADTVAPVQYVDQTVDFYCQRGTPVEYWRNPTSEHGGYESHTPEHIPQFYNRIIQGIRPSTCTSWQSALTTV